MPRLYGPVSRAVRLLLAMFFRRVEVTGLEHIPEEGGGLVVSWHPNGLIDPALIMAFFPRPVIMGARHGLFRWPGLGWLMKAAGAVPIYRASDTRGLSEEERRAANSRSLDSLAEAIAHGGYSCLFPEGDSHDAPDLLKLKTGAARFYYRARQLAPADAPPPVILPVGLHYNAKRRFRSSVLVTFHPPIVLPPWLDLTPPEDEPDDGAKKRQRWLTEEIHRALREVVHATESWELHHLMHRARQLLRAERAARAGVELHEPGMVERQVGYARIWAGYHLWCATQPDELRAILQRLADYHADLRALGLEDDDLDRPPRRGRALRATLLVAQIVGVYLLLPALLVMGGVINVIPFFVLRFGSRRAAARQKDEATIKLLGGLVLYPLFWGIAAYLGARASFELHEMYPVVPATPILAALVVVALGVVGGMVAMRYIRLTRETARAVRVRLTRARQKVSIARLKVERSELCDALQALKEGLDLPGSVTAEGEVIGSEVVPPGGRM